MAKFIFTLTEGIQVIIEADSLKDAQREYEQIREDSTKLKTKIVQKPIKKSVKKGLYGHILDLQQEGFFVEPRTLREIKNKLAELAITNYPITTFPPYLNKFVRERSLKRFKQNKDGKERWVYQNSK